jgi:hypothetical protein
MPVIELGPNSSMTPDQVLAFTSREIWEEVVIIGIQKEETCVIRSSKMSRRDALWLSEQLRLHALGL